MLSTETLFTLHDRRTRDKRQVWTHFVEATLAWPWLWGPWERQFSGAFHTSMKKWRRRSVRPGRFLALWEVNPYSSVGHYEGWKSFLNFTSNLQFKYWIWRFRKCNHTPWYSKAEVVVDPWLLLFKPVKRKLASKLLAYALFRNWGDFVFKDLYNDIFFFLKKICWNFECFTDFILEFIGFENQKVEER